MKVNDFNEKKIYSEVTGLSAIVDNKIKVRMNEFGFYEEYVDKPNNEELSNLVEVVSPHLNSQNNETNMSKLLFSNIKGIKHDKKIGYYKSLYIGHVVEGDFRERASSGGFGTWIFYELFRNKLIDGVIHVKQCNYSEEKIRFKYEISRTIEEIRAGAKTKYYPVELSDVIRKVKDTPGRYAIIGIPSFIYAIRLLAEQDSTIKERIIFTIGLVCGHQKSSKYSDYIAWQLGINPNSDYFIDYRKKMPNQPSNNYGVELKGFLNGEIKTIVKQNKELRGLNWGLGYFKNPASDFVDDVMNETADITLGDAWLPKYTNDFKGNNIVIVRNNDLDNIIKNGINEGKIKVDKVNSRTINRSQTAHYRHTHNELGYRLYKKDQLQVWRPQKRVTSTNKISKERRKIQDLREEISKLSVVAFNKAEKANDLNVFFEEMKQLTVEYNDIYKKIGKNKNRIKTLINRFKILIFKR